jgi:hypothetical protein
VVQVAIYHLNLLKPPNRHLPMPRGQTVCCTAVDESPTLHVLEYSSSSCRAFPSQTLSESDTKSSIYSPHPVNGCSIRHSTLPRGDSEQLAILTTWHLHSNCTSAWLTGAWWHAMALLPLQADKHIQVLTAGTLPSQHGRHHVTHNLVRLAHRQIRLLHIGT